MLALLRYALITPLSKLIIADFGMKVNHSLPCFHTFAIFSVEKSR